MIVFEMTEWESCGKWRVANTKGVGTITNQWWFPAKILDIPLDVYVETLVQQYNADIVYFEDKNLLLYSFDSNNDACRFRRWVNIEVKAALRKKGWL